MIANLFRRGQDPNDHVVPDTFTYRTFADFPKEQKYNMDEVGSDGNKGRKKKVRARDCHPSGTGPVARSGGSVRDRSRRSALPTLPVAAVW